MAFYERGPVRIHYEEFGSGFPLLLIAGGGLTSSTIDGLLKTSPFNPVEEFKGEYRCIASDLRNTIAGTSTGPLEVDRPWDAFTDDHIGLMDHLRIDKFMVMGFCIGGPLIWNLLERAPDRVVAAVPVKDMSPQVRERYEWQRGWVALEIGDRREAKAHFTDRKSTRLNSSHVSESRMPSSA